FTDTRGSLTVIEKILPFPIKRAYWIYDVNTQKRGGHRHFVTSQAFVCLAGSVRVHIKHQQQSTDIVLNLPNQCLLVPPEDWHTLEDFAPGTILLVFDSHDFDPNDYSSEPL